MSVPQYCFPTLSQFLANGPLRHVSSCIASLKFILVIGRATGIVVISWNEAPWLDAKGKINKREATTSWSRSRFCDAEIELFFKRITLILSTFKLLSSPEFFVESVSKCGYWFCHGFQLQKKMASRWLLHELNELAGVFIVRRGNLDNQIEWERT